MAFNYQPISRWTRKRKLQGDLRRALHAIETAVSDSDNDLDRQECVTVLPSEGDISTANAEHVTEECVNGNDYDNESAQDEVICDGVQFDTAGTLSSDYSTSTDAVSDSDISDTDDTVISDLRQWASKHNISHAAVGDLLKILKGRFRQLPKDARTLMQTCGVVQVQKLAGGFYHHFGLIDGLKTAIDKCGISDTIISLQVNIDGLPLFRSSCAQFWPILGLVKNCCVQEPFIIGLFCGNNKPLSAAEYLQQFLDKYSSAQQNGFFHCDMHYKVHLSAVVCDTPARAFIKNVKGHAGYHGCDKCTQEGSYMVNRMAFPETDAVLRTDDSFAAESDVFHHLGPSPFAHLPVGMITRFPIDYMHCCCLGVMRKLFYLWMKGPLKTRLGGRCIELISNKLLTFKSTVPRDFARKPRSILEIDRWKATELRQFLLYTGPVCLQGIIPDVMYDNFMLLSVGIYILLSTEHCSLLLDQAQVILLNFVEHFGKLYGKEYMSYNVHAVLHLADEARTHGVLDNVSCFIFENYLGKIKKLLRKPSAPLEQVVKRMSEMSVKAPVAQSHTLQKSHGDGPVPATCTSHHVCQFRECHLPKFILSLDEKDSCVFIDGDPAVVRNFLQYRDEYFVVYQLFSDIQPFYTYPFQSDRLGIYAVSGNLKELEVAPLIQITRKCCYIPDGLQHIIVPLLH